MLQQTAYDRSHPKTGTGYLDCGRLSLSQRSAMNTKAPVCPGIAITKLGWAKKVFSFCSWEPPTQGFPRLAQPSNGFLKSAHRHQHDICVPFSLVRNHAGRYPAAYYVCQMCRSKHHSKLLFLATVLTHASQCRVQDT